jgi:hypothetical protein
MKVSRCWPTSNRYKSRCREVTSLKQGPQQHQKQWDLAERQGPRFQVSSMYPITRDV